MTSFQTLYRRTAAILSAIAALTATGLATAQIVTLSSGGSCTYSQMTVLPNGNVTVTCGSTSSPGTFTLTAPTSLGTNATTTTQVRVNRSGGSTGAVSVNYALSGTNNCQSVTPTTLDFADGDVDAKPIVVETGPTAATTCTVTLSSPAGGALLGSPSSRNIGIVDPDANVSFAFATTSSVASVGQGNVSIVVNRSGGTNNAWSVPVTLTGTLEAAGVLVSGGGTLSPATPIVLNFPANSSSATITYSPPGATPSVGVPAGLAFSLGTPTTTATTTQTGTQSAVVHSLTLNGPAAGCPVPETSASLLGSAGNSALLKLTSGKIETFILPTPTGTLSTGVFKLSESPVSSPTGAWSYEIHINKCKGLVQASTTDKCYSRSSNMTLHTKVWFAKTTTTTGYNTPAKIAASGYCYAPATEGPWYVNVRYNYPGCQAAGGLCGWNKSWSNWIY